MLEDSEFDSCHFLNYLNRYVYLLFISLRMKKLVFHSSPCPKVGKKALTGLVADGGEIHGSASVHGVGTVRLELTTSAM